MLDFLSELHNSLVRPEGQLYQPHFTEAETEARRQSHVPLVGPQVTQKEPVQLATSDTVLLSLITL